MIMGETLVGEIITVFNWGDNNGGNINGGDVNGGDRAVAATRADISLVGVILMFVCGGVILFTWGV